MLLDTCTNTLYSYTCILEIKHEVHVNITITIDKKKEPADILLRYTNTNLVPWYQVLRAPDYLLCYCKYLSPCLRGRAARPPRFCMHHPATASGGGNNMQGVYLCTWYVWLWIGISRVIYYFYSNALLYIMVQQPITFSGIETEKRKVVIQKRPEHRPLLDYSMIAWYTWYSNYYACSRTTRGAARPNCPVVLCCH